MLCTVSILEYLLFRGLDHCDPNDQECALEIALRDSYFYSAKALLGFDPLAFDKVGKDPRHLFGAARRIFPEMIALLLDYGYDPTSLDREGHIVCDAEESRSTREETALTILNHPSIRQNIDSLLSTKDNTGKLCIHSAVGDSTNW